jgi:hypothetical protein
MPLEKGSLAVTYDGRKAFMEVEIFFYLWLRLPWASNFHPFFLRIS